MANKKLIINSDFSIDIKALGLLICTAQEQTAEMTRLLAPFGISLLQLQIIHALDHHPEKMLTVNQIKSVMIDESPNVSRALNKLMSSGHIVKERSIEDQRVVYIKLTEKGSQTHEDADKEIIKVRLNLSEDDMQKLYDILVKL